MKALDLCCKAGGASMGLYQAGFDVTGVDIKPQPHYPFKFIQADATTLDPEFLQQFDLIWASPPCQDYTTLKAVTGKTYPRLIKPIRNLILRSAKPFIIENVPGAKTELINPVMLCGSSFGLRVRRHRCFETSFSVRVPKCNHKWQNESKTIDKYQHGHWYKSGVVSVHGTRSKSKGGDFWEEAMQIDWMSNDELAEAIPPAYSKYLAEQFLVTRRLFL